MDKAALVARFAVTEEQRIFLSHLYDLMVRCRDRNVITVGNFMSEAERMLAGDFMRACHADYYFAYGGYSDAERCCPIFLPEYLTPEDVVGSPDLAGFTLPCALTGCTPRLALPLSTARRAIPCTRTAVKRNAARSTDARQQGLALVVCRAVRARQLFVISACKLVAAIFTV